MTTIMQTMMKPVSEEASLGSSPEPFTTNTSETVNSIIKSHILYKPSQLMELTENLREAIDEQEREVESSIWVRKVPLQKGIPALSSCLDLVVQDEARTASSGRLPQLQ